MIDQPPEIGNISSLSVVILTSDNAEGILEISPDYVNITGKASRHAFSLISQNPAALQLPLLFVLCISVEEDTGSLLIPVLRKVGSYGLVSAQYISRGLSATPMADYILYNGSLTFIQGQNTSYINVTILDDRDR